MSDLELLRQYGRHRDEAAFAILVDRHLHLVYSAVRRQVRSPELAEDVAQAVFVELSRRALDLPAETHLPGWLYVVARRRAVDALRQEVRRAKREFAAIETATMTTPATNWTALEPVLDEAISALAERDRQAVLMRFFENKSFREIGAALAMSDDNAQKRLSRALERLRGTLARRGIATTAAALAASMSANAVGAAPLALKAKISSAVATLGVPVSTGAGAGLSRFILERKAFLALGAGAATVFAVWLSELETVREQERQIADLERRRITVQQLRLERDSAKQRFAELASATPQPSTADTEIETRWRELAARVAALEAAMQRPDAIRIPELRFLEAKDWYLAAQQRWDAGTEGGLREGLGLLRVYAKYRLAPRFAAAVRRFLTANPDTRLSDVMQLAPYFDPSVDGDVLQRYRVITTSDLTAQDKAATGTSGLISEVVTGEFDNAADRVLQIGTDGWSLAPIGHLPKTIARDIPPKYFQAVQTAALAYGRAHNAAEPPDLDALLPYLPDRQVAEALRTATEELAVTNSVDDAVRAYRQANDGREPTNFAAVEPYFKSPAAAAKFRDFAKRHGKVLP